MRPAYIKRVQRQHTDQGSLQLIHEMVLEITRRRTGRRRPIFAKFDLSWRGCFRRLRFFLFTIGELAVLAADVLAASKLLLFVRGLLPSEGHLAGAPSLLDEDTQRPRAEMGLSRARRVGSLFLNHIGCILELPSHG